MRRCDADAACRLGLGVAARLLPRFAPLPFILLQLQVIVGTYRPAIGYRPQRVGFAQVGAMAFFVALIVLVYRI